MISRISEIKETIYCCIIVYYVLGYTGSVYATILVTCERYMAVCWPFHVRRMLQGKRAVLAILLVLGFSLILNFPRWIEAQQYNGAGYLLRSQYDRNEETGPFTTVVFVRTTSGILRHRLYRKIYHGWIWVTLMHILPIPGICFFNFKIWTQVT